MLVLETPTPARTAVVAVAKQRLAAVGGVAVAVSVIAFAVDHTRAPITERGDVRRGTVHGNCARVAAAPAVIGDPGVALAGLHVHASPVARLIDRATLRRLPRIYVHRRHVYDVRRAPGVWTRATTPTEAPARRRLAGPRAQRTGPAGALPLAARIALADIRRDHIRAEHVGHRDINAGAAPVRAHARPHGPRRGAGLHAARAGAGAARGGPRGAVPGRDDGVGRAAEQDQGEGEVTHRPTIRRAPAPKAIPHP